MAWGRRRAVAATAASMASSDLHTNTPRRRLDAVEARTTHATAPQARRSAPC